MSILRIRDVETYGLTCDYHDQLELLILNAGFYLGDQWQVRKETTNGLRVVL